MVISPLPLGEGLGVRAYGEKNSHLSVVYRARIYNMKRERQYRGGYQFAGL